MKLYCYAVGPIDWWHGGIPTEQMEARLQMKDTVGYTHKLDLDAIWEEAQTLGRALGWEGELTDDAPFPVWGTIPNPDQRELGIWCAWKQPGRGATFVCSTVDFMNMRDFIFRRATLDTRTGEIV